MKILLAFFGFCKYFLRKCSEIYFTNRQSSSIYILCTRILGIVFGNAQLKLASIPDGNHQLWSIPKDQFSDSFPFVFLYKEEGFATTCKNKDYMTILNGNQEIQVYVGRFHLRYLVDVL